MYTFEEARNTLARSRSGFSKRIGNNTWLEVDGDDFVIRHHRTKIIRIHEDGTYTIDCNGWRSVTTKQRLGEYAPARIYSLHGVWLVQLPENMQRDGLVLAYEDGMTFDANGIPVNATDENWRETPKRRRTAKRRPVVAAAPKMATLFG